MLDNIFAKAVMVGTDFNPDVKPEAPPGADSVGTLLNWLTWGVLMLCLGMFIASCGALAWSVFNGGEMRASKGLIITIIASVLVGSAVAIMKIFANV
ncbi:hypothetical protein ACUH9Y_08860 [Dermabacteraceae bacterium P13115]